MAFCAYCGQRATVDIPSIPSHVCLTHAIKFWTGLLAHVRNRAAEFQTPEQPRVASLCNTSGTQSCQSLLRTHQRSRENKQLRLAS